MALKISVWSHECGALHLDGYLDPQGKIIEQFQDHISVAIEATEKALKAAGIE